jgi:phosphoglucomutase
MSLLPRSDHGGQGRELTTRAAINKDTRMLKEIIVFSILYTNTAEQVDVLIWSALSFTSLSILATLHAVLVYDYLLKT